MKTVIDKLSNGIELAYKKNEKTPRPTLCINFSLNSDEKKVGIYAIMTQLFMQGTKNRTAEGIARELDLYAIDFSVDTKLDFMSFKFTCLNEDFEKALEITSDIIKNTTFDEFEKEIEKQVTAISGAFLLPQNDLIRELGIRRYDVTKDMLLVCIEYGVSAYLLVKRAETAGIISSTVAQRFYLRAAKAGWQKNEPSRIAPESPTLFKQLVYRAVNEGEISIQRGAELLEIPFSEVAKCHGIELVEQ